MPSATNGSPRRAWLPRHGRPDRFRDYGPPDVHQNPAQWRRGSGRDITVQADSSSEARQTVIDMFPGALVTGVRRVKLREALRKLNSFCAN